MVGFFNNPADSPMSVSLDLQLEHEQPGIWGLRAVSKLTVLKGLVSTVNHQSAATGLAAASLESLPVQIPCGLVRDDRTGCWASGPSQPPLTELFDTV